MRYLILSFILLGYSEIYAQLTTIAGHVYDSQSGQPVSDCHVYLMDGRKLIVATASDINGSFRINKAVGEGMLIQFTHINYKTKQVIIAEVPDTIRFFLEPNDRLLNEVVVSSSINTAGKGNIHAYTPNEALSSISVMGEPDVVRHISSKPGVSQGMEGTLGLFVRGSNNGSNSILFNGVPVYVSSHLGVLSAFHPETISESSFYLGGAPALYGNFSSSLIEIKTRKHYGDSLHAHFSLSPYLVGGYVSYPIKKDKLSIQIGARTSFLPLIVGKVVDASNDEDEREELDGQLFDFTALLDWKINKRNIIGVMFYCTNDFFDYRSDDQQNKLNWNNTVFKLEWTNRLSSSLTHTTSAYYTTSHSRQEQLTYDYYKLDKLLSTLRLGTELKEWSVQTCLTHAINQHFSYQSGLQAQRHCYEPLSEKALSKSSASSKNKFEKHNAWLFSAFMELTYLKPNRFMGKLGIRNNVWKSTDKSYWDIDLHLLTHIYINNRWGGELTIDRLVQFRHVIEGLPIGWSHNVVFPSDNNFPPEVTYQYYGGVFWKPVARAKINITGGLFYRRMSNLVSYIQSSNLFGFNNTTWQNEVDNGRGESYGMELSASLQGKRLFTTLAYTLSKSDRKFPQINNGETFPFKFDRRNIINLQGKYVVRNYTNKKGKRREQYINGVLSYSTGSRATLPIGSYKGIAPPFWNQRESGIVFPPEVNENAYSRQEMSTINGFKLKDYLRIDLAYTFAHYSGKYTTEFTISVFNILNRRNPYLFYHSKDEWRQLSVIPIMPSVRWAIRF